MGIKRTPQQIAVFFAIGGLAGALIAGFAEASNESIDPRAVIVTALFGGITGVFVSARPWDSLLSWLVE